MANKGFRAFVDDQPILAGCLGCLALGAFAAAAGAVLLFLGGQRAAQWVSGAAGVDSFFGTISDVSGAGFSFEVHSNNNEPTTYIMRPVQPREVSCEEIQALLFPHLTGELETVTVRSESLVSQPDGGQRAVPLECRWTGFPGRDENSTLPE